MSALSYGKIDRCEYLTGEKILLSNRRQIIEQAKYTYFPLIEALEKQTEKQFDDFKSLNLLNKTDKLKQIKGLVSKICWMIWSLIK